VTVDVFDYAGMYDDDDNVDVSSVPLNTIFRGISLPAQQKEGIHEVEVTASCDAGT
jgi:hypothetical protein